MNRSVVLVVDDDPDLQDVVAMVLELEARAAARAESGGQALDMLAEAARGGGPRPCLVLLDLMLPDMRGEDVYRGMRDLSLPEVPVVVMSAASEGPTRAQQMGLPFLPKPFSMEALLDTVSRFGASA